MFEKVSVTSEVSLVIVYAQSSSVCLCCREAHPNRNATAANLGWDRDGKGDLRVKKTALRAKCQKWQNDKLTRGAYAFCRPWQWFTIRPLLQRPHGKVFFAGEHIAEEQGFMEGAVVTGRDAAEQL